MFKHVIAATAVAGLLASGLAVAGSPAESHAPDRPTLQRTPTLTISGPARVREGRTFALVVRTSHQAGRVALLRKRPHGAWKVVAHARADQSVRRVTFQRLEKAAGALRYRAQLRGLSTPVHRILITAPPEPMLFMGASGGENGDIFVGDTYTVSATLLRGESPIVGRAVRVERQAPGSSTWTPAGTYTTDDQGEASFTDHSDVRGLVQYRGFSRALTGETLVGVFQEVSMPAAAGPDLTLRSHGCGVALSGDDAAVDLRLSSTPEPSACTLAAGDFVEATWHLRGLCSPISMGSLTFDGPANGVDVQVTVDGESFVDQHLGANQGTGHLGINGDPPDALTIRMEVSSGTVGPTYVGTISQLDAICL
jgi:hypothetical protein